MPTPTYAVDTALYEFCTVRQLEILEAINKHKSIRAAAVALKMNKSQAREALMLVKKKAALQGYSPDHDLTRKIAPGFQARGHSTLYRRGEPQPVLQWVKTKQDDAEREALVRQSIAAMCEDAKGLAPMVKAPKKAAKELLAVYPLGDPHFGMYAWAKECGDDFDLDIARRITTGAVDRLMTASPGADTGLILPLGDVFHMDDQTNTTPGHKNQLDADGRYVKVLQVGIQTFRHAVLRALEKHAKVIIRFVPGNHDPHAIWALAYSTSAFFSDEPRVTVDLSPAPFWYHQHGQVLIGSTHGDKTKPEQLPGIMAADQAVAWGATKHRYWYTGHIHSQTLYEFPGVTCESFRTLAPKDAYAARHGYRAGRDMYCIVHHADHGEVERHRCDIGMIGG